MQKRTDALGSSLRLLSASSALVFFIAGAESHAGSTVRAGDASRISVTAVAGDLAVTMAGNAVTVSPDATVVLPARIVTGHDGYLGITQAGTNVSIANDTHVEIPAEAVDGNLVARLVQHRGNVFYDVAPREVGKLRIETPLLVAVIKGTQLNVAVQDDSTTISLFEGQLEIRTPDGSEVVQLNAGEIAIRSRVDDAIRVVGMNDARLAAPRDPMAAVADARTTPSETRLIERIALVDDGAVVTTGAASTITGSTSVALKPMADAADFELATVATLEGLNGALQLDAAGTAAVTFDGAGAEVGLSAGLDVAGASTDVGLDAGVDLGGASVDATLDAGFDLADTSVDASLDAGLDLADTSVDASLDAGVDLGSTSVDASLDAGLDLADTSVDAGLDLGGALDAGLEVVDGIVDLGLEQDADTTEPETTPGGGVGGLLGGLL